MREKLKNFLQLFYLGRQLEALLLVLFFVALELFVEQLLRLSVGLKLGDAVHELLVGVTRRFLSLLGLCKLLEGSKP